MKSRDQELLAEAYAKVHKEEEMDPLTDPMFQKALDILEDLQARSPDKFEKFVTRLMDLVDYRKGVSL